MKKMIAVTAGLMLTGSLVSAEAAEIVFSGDARVRYYLENNYIGATTDAGLKNGDTSQSFWSSRIRLQFKITTTGSAYAVGRFVVADGTWDGNNSDLTNASQPYGGGTLNYGAESNLYADIGYVGVPLGPITVEAGTGYNTMNQFLRVDDPYNFIRGIYAIEGATVTAFMEKLRQGAEEILVSGDTYIDDHDVAQYGVNLLAKLANDWSVNATVLYRNDRLAPDNNGGLAADVLFSGKANDIDLWAEIAYKQADYQSLNYTSDTPSTTGDDGYGGYVAAKIPFGIASVSVIGGATFHGFTASGDFGGDAQEYAPFVMMSNATGDVRGMLNTGVMIGSRDGNAYFVGVAPSVKVSDKLTLTVESAYMNAEYKGAYKLLLSQTEGANLCQDQDTKARPPSCLLWSASTSAQLSRLLGSSFSPLFLSFADEKEHSLTPPPPWPVIFILGQPGKSPAASPTGHRSNVA